jgi:hypothetical protein
MAVAAGEPEAGEGAGVGQRLELVVAQAGAVGDVVDRGERAPRRADLEALAGLLAQAGDVAEAEAEGERTAPPCPRRWPPALPARDSSAHRQFEMVTSTGRTCRPVPLRVLHQRRRVVEAHRPVVEHRAGEGGEVVAAQIRRRVGQQREAGGVRFGESRRARTR